MIVFLVFSTLTWFWIHEAPQTRGFLMNLESELVEASFRFPITSVFPVVMNSLENDKKNNGNNGNNEDREEYWVVLLPGTNSVGAVGDTISPQRSVFDTTAGAPFPVAFFVVDEDRKRVEATGAFRFHWTNQQYKDPAAMGNDPVPVVAYNDTPINQTSTMFVIEDGVGTASLMYPEAGEIELTGNALVRIEDQVMPITLSPESVDAGRVALFPAAYRMVVSQPAANRHRDASYTYSGQPFAATATIAAMNAQDPPAVLQRWSPPFAQRLTYSLQASVASSHEESMTLSSHAAEFSWNDGTCIAVLDPLRLTFDEPASWQDVTHRYVFQDSRGVAVSSDADTVSFRLGRMRVASGEGIAGDWKPLRLNLETLQDEGWQTHRDEDGLQVSPDDLDVTVVSGQGSVSIVGSPLAWFAGVARGGADALRFEAGALSGAVQVEVGIQETSVLSFLGVAPHAWRIVHARSLLREPMRLNRERVVFWHEN